MLLALLACAQERRRDGERGTDLPRNVVLVTLDTTRADRCSTYGYRHDTTPALTRLAKRGARFEAAYAPSATTGPTHSSLFTGLYPLTHGVVKNGIDLRAEFATLAERLRAAGYQTAAVVSSYPIAARFGYDQGFDVYDDEFAADGWTLRQPSWEGHTVDTAFDRRATATTERARDWLRRERDPSRPFFLFVHYFDPHDPYKPPAAWYERYRPLRERILAERRAGRSAEEMLQRPEVLSVLYDAEVAYMDSELGRLLDELDRLHLAADTVVAVAGDHGEGLMKHGYLGHGLQIYEETVRVPLVLVAPGRVPEKRTVAAPVALVDLRATLLELVGLEADDGAGTSLLRLLTADEPAAEPEPVFLHRQPYRHSVFPADGGGITARGPQFGVRLGRWKYIVGEDEGTFELYDLTRDPDERDNLYTRRPDKAAELHALIAAWRETWSRAPVEEPELSEEDRAALRALGYLP